MHLGTEALSITKSCRPVCMCDIGHVRNAETGKCIPFTDCPCHHGGRSYTEGDTIVEECNTW